MPAAVRYFFLTILSPLVVCPLFAQGPLECTANAAVPPTVRAEGLTELVGDLVLSCTGGAPTAVGRTVPQINITIFLNANITSRLLSDPMSEALLLIDEPVEANQRACTPGPCSINGVGTPGGVAYGAPGTAPNVYQGRQVGPNAVTWSGVPIDPPGPGAVRTIRVTNVRANAAQLGVSQTLIPSQILMFVSATGSTSLPLSNPQQTVAFVQAGVNSSVLALDANSNPVVTSGTPLLSTCSFSQNIIIRFREGFPSSFKVRGVPAPGTVFDPDSSPAPTKQTGPGVDYFTETGFYNPALPTTNNLNRAGLADSGTRLMARFTNIPNGVFLNVELYDRGTFPSRARLLVTDPSGAGAFSAATADNTTLTVNPDGSAVAVWEVLAADAFTVETLDFRISVSTGSAALGTAQLAAGFAPVSSVMTASGSAPIPRFVPSAPRAAFTTTACLYSLLFPFVSNSGGYDTGLVISNTTVDPFGTSPRQGTCTLYFYGHSGSSPAPPPQTSNPIPAGGQLMWTLSSGGNYGVKSTPNFQGYVIATCAFPFVHGYAQVTAAGGTALSRSPGYIALVLDQPNPDPLFNRTQLTGEVLAH